MNSCAGSRRTGFSSNVAGMVAAVHWMRATIGAPNLLVEHILGGGAPHLVQQSGDLQSTHSPLEIFLPPIIRRHILKAIWQGVTVAESDDIVEVEGNAYFPLGALKRE